MSYFWDSPVLNCSLHKQTYMLAPTMLPKSSCRMERTFQTVELNAWGFSILREQPLCSAKATAITQHCGKHPCTCTWPVICLDTHIYTHSCTQTFSYRRYTYKSTHSTQCLIIRVEDNGWRIEVSFGSTWSFISRIFLLLFLKMNYAQNQNTTTIIYLHMDKGIKLKGPLVDWLIKKRWRFYLPHRNPILCRAEPFPEGCVCLVCR